MVMMVNIWGFMVMMVNDGDFSWDILRHMVVSSSPWGYPPARWMVWISWKIPSFEMDEDWGVAL